MGSVSKSENIFPPGFRPDRPPRDLRGIARGPLRHLPLWGLSQGGEGTGEGRLQQGASHHFSGGKEKVALRKVIKIILLFFAPDFKERRRSCQEQASKEIYWEMWNLCKNAVKYKSIHFCSSILPATTTATPETTVRKQIVIFFYRKNDFPKSLLLRLFRRGVPAVGIWIWTSPLRRRRHHRPPRHRGAAVQGAGDGGGDVHHRGGGGDGGHPGGGGDGLQVRGKGELYYLEVPTCGIMSYARFSLFRSRGFQERKK